MKTYASVQNGIVVEIIPGEVQVDGVWVGLADRYHPDFVAQLIDVTDHEPPVAVSDLYDGSVFTKPVSPASD